MKKNEEQKININTIKSLSEMKSLNKIISRHKISKNDIDKIISEYDSNHKTLLRNNQKLPNNLRFNKTCNSKGHSYFGKKLSNRKKIEEELSSFSKENRKFFSNALNKYNFEMEVYIPQNLTKKEYANKNYLINQLILTEKMNKNTKQIVEPIEKETKKFSKQYKLIKSENKEHQDTYMNDIEEIYQSKGYKIYNIEYKDNENIFTPSFLLDMKFGRDQHKDANKYSNKNFDLTNDKQILEKFEKIFSKKNMDVTDEDNQFKTNDPNNNKTSNNERDEEIKKQIKEEQRIMNMNKREYYIYNKKLKRDINKIKQNLKELSLVNSNVNNSPSLSDINTNRTNYSRGSNLKLIFDQNDKKKEINKISEPKKILKRKDDSKNIFLSARGLDLQTDFSKILPSINSLIGSKNVTEIKNKTIQTSSKTKKNKFSKEKNKQNKMHNLYKYLTNKTESYDYPGKEIESYFKKYSSRKLPKLNPYMGSNIHGLLGEFQNQVKENSFTSIAKGNDYIRFDLDNNYISNKKNSIKNKIENMDEKINNLQFTILEKLLANNKNELLNK